MYNVDNSEQVEKHNNHQDDPSKMDLNKVLKSERLGNILQEMEPPRGDTDGNDK